MIDRIDVVVSLNLHTDDEYMSTEESAIENVQTILQAHIPSYSPMTSDASSYSRLQKRQGNALELLAQIYWNQSLLDVVAKDAIEKMFNGIVPRV